jgi:choline dehydrogenase-like flavoprotein
MLSDVTDLERGARLRADVCIVGAGIAGITVARKLMGSGLSVILLESGGTDFDPVIQDLMAGRTTGLPYYALVDARLRLFGGTLNIWGGRTAEMDGIDFEQRPWIPHSGWPVTHAELRPWVQEARSLLGAEAVALEQEPGAALPEFDADLLRTGFWQIGIHPDRLTPSHCGDLTHAPDVTVLTRATVTRLQARPELGSIEEISVADPGGARATISAGHFVLAAGGLENARLLLASNDVSPHGLGNGHDLVGRFFMEHPHARGGRVYATALWRLLNLYA